MTKIRDAQLSRRHFLQAIASGVALSGLAGILHSRTAPAAIASDALRPMAPWGLQIGDVAGDRAIVWSRTCAREFEPELCA